MHCLISGGTGLIGQLFCRQWLARGNEITVLSRRPQQVPKLCGPTARACTRLQEVVPPVDLVVNLAGEPIAQRWNGHHRAEIRRSRLETTTQLVQWSLVQTQRPQYFLSGSAVGYYGNRGDDLLQENSSPGTGFAAELCREWESLTAPLQQAGVCVGIMRTSMVLSRRGGVLKKMLPAFRFGLGGPMGSGEQWMSWIHEYDLVNLMLHAIDNHLCQPFNACTPEAVTNNSFARQLSGQLHRPGVMRTPASVLRLLFGEMAQELLLASQKMEPHAALNSNFRFRYPTLEQAFADLLGNVQQN